MIKREMHMNCRIPITLMKYLESKGIEDDNISDINSFPTEEELTVNMCKKVAKKNKQNYLICCRKLLNAFIKNKKAFDDIVHNIFGRDYASMHTLLNLCVVEVKIYT